MLTECKQNAQWVLKQSQHLPTAYNSMFRFASLVSRLEKKPQCKGRSLELFLTYPMHQVMKDKENMDISLLCTCRYRAISSPCTSCWPTLPQTMLRRTLWSRPGYSWRTCHGRCMTRSPRQRTSGRIWPLKGWLWRGVIFCLTSTRSLSDKELWFR